MNVDSDLGCTVGLKEELKAEVELHQRSAFRPFLFAVIMERQSDEVRQESMWIIMFADDIVIYREQVEEHLFQG